MPKYLNRELSWLSFNERVLQEAENPDNPLLERLKFLGIFSSNLDEFFSVRVGTLQGIVNTNKVNSKIVSDAKNIKNKINKEALRLRDKFERTFTSVKEELEENNISIINHEDITEKHKSQIDKFYRKKLRPRLIPIMLNDETPFPYLQNAQIYLACILENSTNKAFRKYAVIQIPVDIMSRFLKLKDIDNHNYIIMIDDIIRLHLKDIFSIFDADIFNAYTIKLTRNAEINLNKDVTVSFFEQLSESIEQRDYGKPVRFVYDKLIPQHFLDYLLDKLELKGFQHIIPGGVYHNARDFMAFPKIKQDELYYEDLNSLDHPVLIDKRSIFEEIANKDILLQFPYHSFDPIVDLLREAAIDHKVTDIKMTLYRVAKRSNIVNALINAAKNGKKVSVLLEIQARFDEKANLYWTEQLKREGVNIISGFPEMKVHSKLLMISRIEDNIRTNYAVIGTGNYNESTAKLYVDHALLTKDQRITKDVNTLFQYLELNYMVKSKYRHILVAPIFLRKKLNKLIKNEMKNALLGKPAFIYLKLNNLVDNKVIDLLYKAAEAGVKIKLIVRGICCLIPDYKDFKESIEVVSIIDKYLEHSRIYVFCNDDDNKFFISSADIMPRNLDRRIEVACPIYDDNIKQELWEFLQIQLNDNVKARIIDKEHLNTFKSNNLDQVRSQDDFFKHLEGN